MPRYEPPAPRVLTPAEELTNLFNNLEFRTREFRASVFAPLAPLSASFVRNRDLVAELIASGSTAARANHDGDASAGGRREGGGGGAAEGSDGVDRANHTRGASDSSEDSYVDPPDEDGWSALLVDLMTLPEDPGNSTYAPPPHAPITTFLTTLPRAAQYAVVQNALLTAGIARSTASLLATSVTDDLSQLSDYSSQQFRAWVHEHLPQLRQSVNGVLDRVEGAAAAPRAGIGHPEDAPQGANGWGRAWWHDRGLTGEEGRRLAEVGRGEETEVWVLERVRREEREDAEFVVIGEAGEVAKGEGE